MRTLLTGILATAAATWLPSAGAEATSAHPRPAPISAFESAFEGRGSWLQANVSGVTKSVVSVGGKISFSFTSDRDAYLTVVHVDGEGNVLVLIPNQIGVGPKIAAGETLDLPIDDAFSVSLPIGPESIFAFATEEELTAAQLGLLEFDGGLATLDPELGPGLASCLQKQIAAANDRSSAARIDYLVAASKALPYTAADVEQYFSTRTRSFKRPTLDMLIQFENDSADLTPEARGRLDEVGKALGGSQMAAFGFALNGHTDDVGDADYNLELSERRALAAQAYLVENYGVKAQRLEAFGHGEGSPKMDGSSRAARGQNRRVELELKNRGTRSIKLLSNYRCGASR